MEKSSETGSAGCKTVLTYEGKTRGEDMDAYFREILLGNVRNVNKQRYMTKVEVRRKHENENDTAGYLYKPPGINLSELRSQLLQTSASSKQGATYRVHSARNVSTLSLCL